MLPKLAAPGVTGRPAEAGFKGKMGVRGHRGEREAGALGERKEKPRPAVEDGHRPRGWRENRKAQPGRPASGREGPPEASPHLSSGKKLPVAEAKSKIKKNKLSPLPIQETAEGIYISWGDLAYKL